MGVSEVSVSQQEIVEAMQNSPDVMAGVVIPDVHTANFPPILLGFWFAMVNAITQVGKVFPKLAIAIPRGHAKTTMVKLLVVWAILFTKKKFVLIICASEPNAINIIADIADMLDSENIRKLFGDWRSSMTKDTGSTKEFTFRGRSIILKGVGAKTSSRGINRKNSRPDIMIFEDAQTKESAESTTEADSFISWFHSTAMKSKSPDGTTFIYVGNMYKDTPLVVDEKGNTKVYGCHLRNLQLNPMWRTFITGAFQADGSMLWPEVHPREVLLAELADDSSSGKEDEWFAEVQNDPTFRKTNRLLPENCFVPTDEDILAWGAPHSRYLVLDPSLGKKQSDDVVIGGFEVWEDIPVQVHLDIPKKSVPDVTLDLLKFALDNNYPAIFIEGYGMQGAIVQWFDKWKELSGDLYRNVEIIGITRGRTSKNAQILDTFKRANSKQVGFKSVDVFPYIVTQAEMFDPTTTKNLDDILDVASYGILVWDNPQMRLYTEIPLTGYVEKVKTLVARENIAGHVSRNRRR